MDDNARPHRLHLVNNMQQHNFSRPECHWTCLNCSIKISGKLSNAFSNIHWDGSYPARMAEELLDTLILFMLHYHQCVLGDHIPYWTVNVWRCCSVWLSFVHPTNLPFASLQPMCIIKQIRIGMSANVWFYLWHIRLCALCLSVPLLSGYVGGMSLSLFNCLIIRFGKIIILVLVLLRSLYCWLQLTIIYPNFDRAAFLLVSQYIHDHTHINYVYRQ